MNRMEKERKGKFGSLLNGRTKDILLMCVLAIVLFYAAWKIFRADEKDKTVAQLSETEAKVMRILQEIDGVGDAEVVVCETEDGGKNVVVVCEGGKNIRVIMDVREAVAAALGTEEKAVKIYLKKE